MRRRLPGAAAGLMEFHCRLGTPGGEIIEGVYVADTEARLRREFEEKGLYVLGIQRGGRFALPGLALPTRNRIPSGEFLVFNQELATLLKAGLPLVQSLDILRRRVANPVFKAVLDDVHERVRAGSALSEAFEAHGACFPGVYTASLMAGEKSGSLEQVIRRYVAYVKVVAGVQAQDDFGAGLPGHPAAALAVRRRNHRAAGRARVRGVLRAVRPGAAAVDANDRRDVSRSQRAYFFWLLGRGRRLAVGILALGEAAGTAAEVRSLGAAAADAGADCAEVRDVAGGAHAGDAARRRHSARERDRGVGARRSATSSSRGELQAAAQQVREGRALAAAMERLRRVSRTSQ